jgi:hypothetical protein
VKSNIHGHHSFDPKGQELIALCFEPHQNMLKFMLEGSKSIPVLGDFLSNHWQLRLVDANVDGPWLPANHQVAAKYMGRNQLILASSATPVPLKNWKAPSGGFNPSQISATGCHHLLKNND